MTGRTDPPQAVPQAEDDTGAPKVDGGQVGQEGGWRRVHPLTPLVSSWQFLAVALVFLGQNAGERVLSGDGLPPGGFRLGLLTGGLAVLFLLMAGVVVVGLALLSWRMTRYRVTAEALELHQGVLFRRHRRARLDRLQAVDVVQPFVARMAGLARLTLEVAGGGDSKIALAYLSESQAISLRNHLLARAAGVHYDTPQAPQAPERLLLEVPTGRLIGSLVLSATTVSVGVFSVAMVVATAVAGTVAVLAALLPGVIGTVSVFWNRFNGGFAFRLSTSPDGLRLRHGLLEHRAQTVPPGRVQGIGLRQSWFWRRVDWWRMQVNIAGYGNPGSDTGSTETVLLPVGTRAEVLAILALLLPDLGVGPDDDPVAVVQAALSGSGDGHGFTTSPARARWLDPMVWRRNGFRVTDEVLLIRTGRLARSLVLVPHARTQSVGLTQGLLLRRLGLVSFELHSTPGPIAPGVRHLSEPDGARLLGEQAERARQARTAAPPERWMEAALPPSP